MEKEELGREKGELEREKGELGSGEGGRFSIPDAVRHLQGGYRVSGGGEGMFFEPES